LAIPPASPITLRLRGYISQWTTNPRDGTQFPDHAAAPAQIARTLWVRLMTSPG